MKQRDYNVSFVGFGDVLETSADLTPNGVDAITFQEMTNVTPGTLKNVSDENEITDFQNAEDDKIDFSVISKEGAKKFEFQVFDVDFQNLLLAFGGSVTDGYWKAPIATYGGIEKSLKIVSRSVNGIKAVKFFPRVKVTAMNVGEYTGDATNDIKFSVTILTPTDSSTSTTFSNELIYSKANPPMSATYVASTGVLTFDYIDGFGEATDYEYTEDAGGSWNNCATNPETITASLTAVGLRVKKYASSTMSEAQWQESTTLNVTVI